MECWGAKGANCTYGGIGGKGGYSTGNIVLAKEKELYLFVGGGVNFDITTGGYNGGGNGDGYKGSQYGYGGGGATDIRLYVNASKDWNNSQSLYSRIMVAGGGGGSGSYQQTPSTGGAGGGTSGQGGYQVSGYTWSGIDYSGTGGTQEDGGNVGTGDGANTAIRTNKMNSGGLGYGGNNSKGTVFGSPGGGSGYWGGCAAIRGHGGGGGGSSFISGMTGCKAPSGYQGSNTNVLKYSGEEYIFSGASTKAGDDNSCPSNPGYVDTNVTNGYAKITSQ